jgi:hypothetical protein
MQRAVFAPARAVRVLPASLGLAFLTACSLQFGTGVEARDTWTRSYQVKAGVMLEIRETNGLVQIDAADGDAVVVNATRITKASTEEAAKAMLKDFTIAETVTPDQVTLDGNPPGVSLNINTSRRVDYRITVRARRR